MRVRILHKVKVVKLDEKKRVGGGDLLDNTQNGGFIEHLIRTLVEHAKTP